MTEDEKDALADRLIKYYRLLKNRQWGDLAFALHELAHFALLFRRPPNRTRRDIERMQSKLDKLPIGLAQLHELRVVALQRVVQPDLGLPFVLDDALETAWSGFVEVSYETERGGRPVVHDREQAREIIESFRPAASGATAFKRSLQACL